MLVKNVRSIVVHARAPTLNAFPVAKSAAGLDRKSRRLWQLSPVTKVAVRQTVALSLSSQDKKIQRVLQTFKRHKTLKSRSPLSSQAPLTTNTSRPPPGIASPTPQPKGRGGVVTRQHKPQQTYRAHQAASCTQKTLPALRKSSTVRRLFTTREKKLLSTNSQKYNSRTLYQLGTTWDSPDTAVILAGKPSTRNNDVILCTKRPVYWSS